MQLEVVVASTPCAFPPYECKYPDQTNMTKQEALLYSHFQECITRGQNMCDRRPADPVVWSDFYKRCVSDTDPLKAYYKELQPWVAYSFQHLKQEYPSTVRVKDLNDHWGKVCAKNFTGDCHTVCRYIQVRYFDVYLDDLVLLQVAGNVVRNHTQNSIEGGSAPWYPAIEQLRTNPVEGRITTTEKSSQIIINEKENKQQESLGQLIQMLLIVVLLGVSSALFGRDADKLIINPLERMSNFVEKVSKNPLASVEVIKQDAKNQDVSETDFVEGALRKFCKLLQVAFGEAGAGVIGKNLKAGAELDPMSPDNGIKMRAIFGFVEIRSFSDCTECLEEQVMIFVNTIARYVHNAVQFCHGSPNKNIGDVFLLCWRMNDWDQEWDPSSLGYVLADEALKSYIQIIHDTSACPQLRQITDHPELQRRMPGFRVNMGFGLHIGWGIEGAIGSKLKIDASYLSPNVNLSSRLEAATKQYGVQVRRPGRFSKHRRQCTDCPYFLPIVFRGRAIFSNSPDYALG